jgi:tetratricopeptide (TPR) repeat protein
MFRFGLAQALLWVVWQITVHSENLNAEDSALTKDSSNPKASKWLALALVVATILAYAPALSGPFIFDDLSSIVENPDARQLASAIAVAPGSSSLSGRPVARFSLAVNYAINELIGIDQRPDPDGPYKAVGYRIMNILIHLCVGALLFAVVRAVLNERSIPDNWRAIADPVAGIVCALWLLHPIQSEVVNYVVQRTESLASLFYLTTLYASIKAWDALTDGDRLQWYCVAVISCVLGMGSKEIAVSAALAVILYDRAFRLHSWNAILNPAQGRRWFYLALIISCVGSFFWLSAGARGNTAGFNSGMSWQNYLYSQCWAIGHYLRLVVWPNALAIDYGDQAVTGLRGVPGLILLVAFGVATLIAWTKLPRRGWFAFLGAWFFMLLAPSSSFVPIRTEIAAERRIYLALAAVLVLAVVGVEWLRRRYWSTLSAQRLALCSLGIAAALALTTAVRSHAYANAESLWQDNVAKVPKNLRGYVNLGSALLVERPPKYATAESLFSYAATQDSSCRHGCAQMASSLSMQGRFAEAVPWLERALAHDPKNARIEEYLALVLMKTGSYKEAIPHLELLTSQNPTDRHFMILGVAYLSAGLRDSAINTFQRALQVNSHSATLGLLGTALTAAGRASDALPYLQRLVREHPRSAMALAQLGLAQAQLGDTVAAAASEKAAIINAHDDPAVFLCVGRALAILSDTEGAKKAFIEAVKLNAAYADSVPIK